MQHTQKRPIKVLPSDTSSGIWLNIPSINVMFSSNILRMVSIPETTLIHCYWCYLL